MLRPRGASSSERVTRRVRPVCVALAGWMLAAWGCGGGGSAAAGKVGGLTFEAAWEPSTHVQPQRVPLTRPPGCADRPLPPSVLTVEVRVTGADGQVTRSFVDPSATCGVTIQGLNLGPVTVQVFGYDVAFDDAALQSFLRSTTNFPAAYASDPQSATITSAQITNLGVIELTARPFVTDFDPQPNQTGVSPATTVFFVVATAVGNIDAASIAVQVNGVSASVVQLAACDDATGPACGTQSDRLLTGFLFTYTPPQPFPTNSQVSVTVGAADTNVPPRSFSGFSYSFTTGLLAVTATPSATPTGTSALTASPTPTASSTATQVPTRTAMPTATMTAMPTETRGATATVTPSATASATSRPSATETATLTPTETATGTATPTASWTPSATATASPTLTPTVTPSASATATLTSTASPTATPSGTPTATPTATATSLQGCINADVIAPVSGQFTYPTSGGPLSAVGISVNSLVGLDTPSGNSVTLQCIGCTLSFTTGDLVATTANSWEFGAGGSVKLVGGVDLDGSGTLGPGDIPAGTTLFSGTFTSPVVVTKTSGAFGFVSGGFSDTKEPRLLSFYGVPADAMLSGSLNLGIGVAVSPPATFATAQPFSGSADNCTP